MVNCGHRSQVTNCTFAGVTVLIGAMTIHYYATYRFWSKRGIPGPTPIPFFGNALTWMVSSVDEVDAANVRKYGKVYGVYNGSEPVLMVTHAESIQHIWIENHKNYKNRMNFDPQDKHVSNGIIFSSGTMWEDERSLFNAALNTAKLKRINTQGICDKLRKFLTGSRGQSINMFDTFSLHYIDIVASTFYRLGMDSFAHPNAELLRASRDILAFSNVYTFFIGYNLPLMAKYVAPYFATAGRVIEQFVTLAFKEWKASNRPSEDFLDLVCKSDMKSDQKMAAAIEVIGAGFLPVVSSSTFLMYEFGRAPEMYKKAQKEADELRALIEKEGSGRKDPNFDEIRDNMKYLDNCYRESLRLHPASCRNWRVVTDDSTELIIPDIGIDVKLPKGTAVTLPVLCLHTDPDLFEDPLAFVPDRWTSNPEMKKHIQTFGSGPRKCVGEPFSYLMVKLTMYNILTNYDMKLGPGCHTKRRAGSFVPHAFSVFAKLTPRN